MDSELSRAAAAGRVEPLPSPEQVERARALLGEEGVRKVRRYLEEDDERVLKEQKELTEIEAPPFGEEARARRMAELLEEAGVRDVETDREGNVVGLVPAAVPGGAGRRPLVVSAHLDTVFPTGTDVRVRRTGERLVAPGISDDGRGLAALLALGRVLSAGWTPLRHPVLIAATVGEEGPGDLRGVRHLFREGGRARSAAAFVSLDGAGMNRIVNSGLGSRRFRACVRGPGGHSWVNWGTANPIHALGAAVARWIALELPEEPPATLTVARWGGGTSINSIPQEAWVELELRCLSEGILERLDGQVREVLATSVAEANESAPDATEDLRASLEVIGRRPAGMTDADSLLVRSAAAATRVLGGTPELAVSSTDANYPMFVGVPAVTLGAGGEAGQAHTTDEWYRNVDGPDGILRALLTLLLIDRED